MHAPIPSARSIRYAHQSKRSALPIRFSLTPKAISSRVTAGFRPPGRWALPSYPSSPCPASRRPRSNAGWDLEILQLELGELGSIDVDVDLTLTGFSTGEIDVILTSAVDPDDEVIPPVPATPRTKPGDIWILGEHRVGCGDGRDAEFLQRVVGRGAGVDAAFLDPPYNVRIGGHAVSAGSHREFAMASGEMSEAEFRSFLADTLGGAASVSREGAVHFVCMDWRHMDDVSAGGCTSSGARLDLCIWDKYNTG